VAAALTRFIAFYPRLALDLPAGLQLPRLSVNVYTLYLEPELERLLLDTAVDQRSDDESSLGLHLHSARMRWLQQLGFSRDAIAMSTRVGGVFKTIDEATAQIDRCVKDEALRASLPFEIDGFVVKVCHACQR